MPTDHTIDLEIVAHRNDLYQAIIFTCEDWTILLRCN